MAADKIKSQFISKPMCIPEEPSRSESKLSRGSVKSINKFGRTYTRSLNIELARGGIDSRSRASSPSPTRSLTAALAANAVPGSAISKGGAGL